MKKRIIVLATIAVLLASLQGGVAAVVSSNPRLALEWVDQTVAVVTADRLNVREGPSTEYTSIYKLEKGQSVTVMGRLGEWYAIYNVENGIVGAVDGRYIEFQNTGVVTAGANDERHAMTGIPVYDEDLTAAKDKDKDKDKTVPTKETIPAAVKLSQDEQKLLDLVNKARADNGLEQLTADENLMKVARMKAKDMVDKNYFSHQSPTYGSPFDMMRQFDSTFKSAGENIAGNKTVEGAFKAWMASDSHKKNILNPGYKITGIGIETSASYGKILVQQFIGG